MSLLVHAACKLTALMRACNHSSGNNDGNKHNATCTSSNTCRMMCYVRYLEGTQISQDANVDTDLVLTIH